MSRWRDEEQAAGRAAIGENRRPPSPPPKPPDALSDERMFRVLVIEELLVMKGVLLAAAGNLNKLKHQMENLMSASDDLKAAAAAIDTRMDGLTVLVGMSTQAIITAIATMVAGTNPDGSVSAAVANAVVMDLQNHLAAAEAKVGELGAAVAQLGTTVTPATPSANPSANPPANPPADPNAPA